MPKKPSFLFVSPHLDDAILSCGGLLSNLSREADVTIATVFTNAHNISSNLSIRRFLKQTGYSDSEKLFSDRRTEDRLVNDLVGVKTVHLGFTDALYRLIPGTKKFTYPLFSLSLRFGRISSWDIPLVKEIQKKLSELIDKNTAVFAPAAIGKHMDHQLVRMAMETKFESLVLWSDFPYNLNDSNHLSELKKQGYKVWQWRERLGQKRDLIKMYKTQVGLLFKGEVPIIPEYYVAKQQIVPLPAAIRELEPLAE